MTGGSIYRGHDASGSVVVALTPPAIRRRPHLSPAAPPLTVFTVRNRPRSTRRRSGLRLLRRRSGLRPTTYRRIQQLQQLHESGALTDDEFAAAKAKLLA
ncbi:SHOCT domain-containing protein [Tomitella fengzijianii]|uniref:SHOCT domain-containing protein n=1 Tax=Tomitella fengzijianii TaxID=2597660 RepID=UPI001F204D8C|nr:SHOCT domain-containing protein [Tomitella fengzijianii]